MLILFSFLFFYYHYYNHYFHHCSCHFCYYDQLWNFFPRSRLLNSLNKRQSCHHIETSQLICSANQLTVVYMMATLALNELMQNCTTVQLFMISLFEDMTKCDFVMVILQIYHSTFECGNTRLKLIIRTYTFIHLVSFLLAFGNYSAT